MLTFIELQEYLLLFNEIPEKLLNDQEAKILANKYSNSNQIVKWQKNTFKRSR